MNIDKTIKKVVIGVIREQLATTKPCEYKSVRKHLELHHTDLDSITAAFESAYSMEGYEEGSACITSSEDQWSDCELRYSIRVETTQEERERKIIERINKCHYFHTVYEQLTELGYKRIGFCSGELDAFEDTTIYDMYMNDTDRLTSYFMLYFKKD